VECACPEISISPSARFRSLLSLSLSLLDPLLLFPLSLLYFALSISRLRSVVRSLRFSALSYFRKRLFPSSSSSSSSPFHVCKLCLRCISKFYFRYFMIVRRSFSKFIVACQPNTSRDSQRRYLGYIIIRSHDKSIVRSGDFCIHNIYATLSAYSLVVR